MSALNHKLLMGYHNLIDVADKKIKFPCVRKSFMDFKTGDFLSYQLSKLNINKISPKHSCI